MAVTAGPRWRAAELVADRWENAATRTLMLRVPDWPGHLPGQHVDVRLTAPDGYQATRSYSLAAPAAGDRIELTVQRVPDGEVSPYLTEVLPVGASVEVLGPVGGWFVWRGDDTPTLLIAGGAGIVPLAAILRARLARPGAAPWRLLYSLRSPALLYYPGLLNPLAADPATPPFSATPPATPTAGHALATPAADDAQAMPAAGGALAVPVPGDALAAAGDPGVPVPGDGAEVLLGYTREAPPGDPRPPGRLSETDLREHGLPPEISPACFVCGPTGFVEAMTRLLTRAGHSPARIKTERFGPTGG